MCTRDVKSVYYLKNNVGLSARIGAQSTFTKYIFLHDGKENKR